MHCWQYEHAHFSPAHIPVTAQVYSASTKSQAPGPWYVLFDLQSNVLCLYLTPDDVTAASAHRHDNQ